ncbi:hypothetical protein H112_05660 [Trichophyton rubrum D6]|uniref:DUF4246 domain-containing protein n=3 Tax=Trichophyton TaxID=5550 RepID=A0A080WSK2_TRIRC|nr:uncharacterized protein TERG_11991 [Trichophyton rubrum CBS 118892]EZF40346.1 hypothetical protein H102_05646 [Trichophyton rubrum CBS 100081]EZF50851.1 hypothetical protein H103_05673 [Trichophyton rubrum CBS 288.86]EZF61569.1 hypothetical protein H104_05658 [Trichophyton rubrum CBS 289.86]EZF72332.1 hypothetical protein H105_05686 [Trichophyton soudanense CBS 452.61]EZF82991.1 hypothetical protein H110_05668 [Trichophyton rubrum MR1448]EZF93536.1 hypothetical protein H113_05713 [Trichoph
MALRPYSYFVKELRASSRVLYSTMSPAIKLPGYGIPLNGFRAWRASPGDGFITNTEYDGSKDFRGRSFPNALDQSDIDYGSISMSMITLREHAMIHAMNDITDKPGWEDKVKA